MSGPISSLHFETYALIDVAAAKRMLAAQVAGKRQ
jgi:hypothetical protein